jgi:uncharacterized glyoxalase superfamily protein PhnB
MDRLDRTIDVLLTGGDATSALSDAELAPLAVLAGELRSCPAPDFKARLRAKLKGRQMMSIVLEDTVVREGFTTVTPHLLVPDAGLLDFLVKAFDAVEVASTPTRNHTHREVRVGNSMLMISERTGAEPAPAAYHVFVPDVDAVYERAVAAGGKPLGAPENRSYGERSGFVEDAYGNYWFIATHLGPTPVPPGLRTVTPYLHPRGAQDYIEFLSRAFGAFEEFRAEHSGVIMHARVRVGNAAVEMGDAGTSGRVGKAGLYLYVADVDALYERAVAAGAKSILRPMNQQYGDRLAVVEDTMGYTWAIARPAERG